MNEDSGRLKEGELVEQRWEVQHLLGMGELAEVYEVADRWTGGSAVLKLFAPQYLMAPAAWAGYQEYSERVRALSLPALVNPFAFGIHPGSGAPFSVAERVGLPALDQLVATVGTLLPAQFARILRELAPLLDTMHRAGIVHRNLKPSNLFCSLQGSKGLQVSDTTVSALRRELAPFPGWGGTPGWVAPEALDPRAPEHVSMDVYAVGLLAFFALTDRNPFLSLSSFEPQQFQQELFAPLPALSGRARELGARLDPKFDGWFERALAIDPGARFGSVLAMANELLELTQPAPGFGTVSLAPTWSAATDTPGPVFNPSIRTAELSADPGVASVSVQPLLFNEQLPRVVQAVHASAPVRPVTASPALPVSVPTGQRPAYSAKPVLLAAAGTGAIAVVAAVIVTVVLMREREAASGGEAPARTQAPPQASSAPSALEATPAPPVAAASSPSVPEPAPTPEPGSVKFECSPEPCSSLHCDGREYTDLTKAIALPPGEHRCIGGAEGYLPLIVTFRLDPKQELVQALELKTKTAPPAPRPRRSERTDRAPAAKPPSTSPCGTFINPCK
ncbi:MAG TPA: hypothetical protein VFU02_15200 [Polyangiaceae bacterium]|nr:hypothetical protein [Polyangiaceae bacterium]